MNNSDKGTIVLILCILFILLGLATWGGSCLGESRIRKPYEETKTQLASVQADLTQAQSASAGLQKDNAALQTQLKSVQTDLSQAQYASASLQKNNVALQTQLKSVQTDLSQAQSASDSLQKNNVALQTQLESVQADLTQAQYASASLQKDNATLRMQLSSAQAELTQTKSQYSSLQDSNAALQTQLASSQTQLSQVQSLQNTLQTLQQNNAALQAQLASWYTWIRSLPPTPSTVTTGPNITLSPTSGPAGSTITVTGSGFVANVYGNVFLDINRNGIFDTGEPSQYLTTSSNGTFSISLTMPSVTAGAYQVMVSIPAGSLAQPLGIFNVTTIATTGPNIILSPTSGPMATTVTVTGSGFVANVYGNVFLDINRNGTYDTGEPSQSVTTSSNGTFSISLTMPYVAVGAYQLMVSIPAGSVAQPLGIFNITTPD